MTKASDSPPAHPATTVERTSDHDLVVTRTFDAPSRTVYEAWANSELFQRWWAPRSRGVPIASCAMDVRKGGTYRLEFRIDAERTIAFHGTYLDVTPPARLAWTNEESDDGAITTVTFEDTDRRTRLVLHERYPTKEALDASIDGMEGSISEQFAQLDALLAEISKTARHS